MGLVKNFSIFAQLVWTEFQIQFQVLGNLVPGFFYVCVYLKITRNRDRI
jgi:hypothetical protein